MTDDSTEALNQRIDALVEKLDTLIGEVKIQAAEVKLQAELRQRFTTYAALAVVALALGILALGWRQNNLDRQQSCKSQNVTRAVVHDLLKSAQDAVNSQKPPEGLSVIEQQQYDQQVAQARAFYRTQLAKVAPLHC
jgi:hypothetical protein